MATCASEECFNVSDVLSRLNAAGFTVYTTIIDDTAMYTVLKDGVYRAWQWPAMWLLKIAT